MALTDRVTKNVNAGYWSSTRDSVGNSFPVKNRYTAGVAGQKFFNELKENGKIFGTRCNKCDHTYVPARLYCEKCFERLEEWIDVGTKGTIYSYTVAYVNKDGSPKNNQTILAAIKIADGIIIHRLDECSPDEISNGMEVEAVIRQKAERTGYLLDIKYFKPC